MQLLVPTWLHSSRILLCSQKNKDLATEPNANTLGQQTAEYMKGMALHGEGSITSSPARWLTDGNLTTTRKQTATAARDSAGTHVKPSLHRHTSLAALLQSRNGNTPPNVSPPGPHADVFIRRVAEARSYSRCVPKSGTNLGFGSHRAPWKHTVS